ncbi:glycoside hydrolase family 2 TIM barrel-domain containing protein [Elizabethkingia sp. JS20170427COW]|uniref:glycoside hydrolase family 2 protein n=1 Tax=Elizabethkingia sp. JS20170427COW TaxID=2583851 RepID=UPI001110AFD5|nr:glycoside hydrolase family 2 TIM barrel-domain containing protein [Elizabethkingia sp. JS20170427COW]QCX53477.1 glycoside hydrolase family 2 protein [Elizabethkingia sp. JS20170427COW]
MIKNIGKALAFFSFSCLFAQERTQVSLNQEWKFTPGYEVQKNVFTTVNLPHTYNLDATSGKIDYYRGFGNYLKKIKIPKEWEGKSIFLRFGAANHTATVQINGKTIGEHFGGYTAFGFDISEHLKYGEDNNIEVRVSNALDLGVMPLVGDFNFYGGIYRDVNLIVLPDNHIAVNQYASKGVRIVQEDVTQNLAKIKIQTTVVGKGNLKIKIKDAKGNIIESSEQYIADSQTVISPFTIKKPILWNGRKNPHLYQAEISFDQDKITESFGLRFFKVDNQNRFWLNGEILELKGVGRHQDYAIKGNAIFREQMEEDMKIMLDMGVNAVRLTHYPHDPYFLELCDQYGIIAWSEIPFIGPGGYRDKGFVNTSRFKENGKLQLAEMIEQYYNHPSILFWGLFNEIKEAGDNPTEYVKELNALAKQNDPTRLTVAASNQGGGFNYVTDLLAFNQYFGWYGGKPQDVGTWAKGMREKYPQLKLGLSEYGAGASPFQQQEELKAVVPTSRWHPENWQNYFHEEHWRVIHQEKPFWGTFVWVMFDFYAAHRTEGEREGINDKGLVTIDRKTKKDAFYFYKANWNKEDPFVYIAERRNRERKNKTQNFKVYSNLPEIELFINDKSYGKRNNKLGIFTWENIALPSGDIHLQATGKDKKIKDETSIVIL